MSGILGIFNRLGRSVTVESMTPALEKIAPYGRDQVGTWTSGNVGFGHQMLRLTPESATEALPLTLGDLTITADARLDNRDELFAALPIPHEDRAGMPDSVLILRAYEKWNEDAPLHLIGDYAFAIWDERSQCLFCARDHIGARPFYYYHTPEVFAFASDIRGLIAFSDVIAEIDEAEIARYLLGQVYYLENTYTFFKNIYKLQFGHRLTVTLAELETSRYWFPAAYPQIRLPKLEDYADSLFELVEQAVAARLRTNASVGSHVSGGIDSAAVAVIAARLLRERGRSLTAFAWSPPPGEHPEQTEHRRIEAICRQEGLTPLYTEPTLDDRAIFQTIDISTLPVNTVLLESVVQRKAAQLGVQIMLSGWGGDEAVSYHGRGLSAELLLHGHWRQLVPVLGMTDLLHHPGRLLMGARRFWRDAAVPMMPDSLYTVFMRKEETIGRIPPLINPAFAAQMKPFLRPPNPPVRELPGVHATQIHLYEHGHLTGRIESWTSFGVEQGITYLYPLLDRRLLEFIYAIPGDVHVQKEYTRYLFRFTMARILPEGMPWDNLKDDPALLQRGPRLPPEQVQQVYQRWLEDERLNHPNPWVDVPRLREILLSDPSTRGRGDSPTRAINCLTIWHKWNTSLKPKSVKND